MADAKQFAQLIAAGNFTATISVLDEALAAARLEHAAVQAKLLQLHLNRGWCHQRLGLNRKALKVGARGRGARRLRCQGAATSPHAHET
jgi:hypothetical protein